MLAGRKDSPANQGVLHGSLKPWIVGLGTRDPARMDQADRRLSGPLGRISNFGNMSRPPLPALSKALPTAEAAAQHSGYR